MAIVEVLVALFGFAARLSCLEPAFGAPGYATWEKKEGHAATVLAKAYSALLRTPAATAHGASLKLRSLLKWEMGDGQRAAITQAAEMLSGLAVTPPQRKLDRA